MSSKIKVITPPQAKIYQTPRLITNLSLVVSLVAGVLASMNWAHSDKNWLNVVLTAFFLFALVATISAYLTKVTISDAFIEITKGFGTKKYGRGQIEDIAVAKGGGAVHFLLKDGIWVELPDLNISPVDLRNVVKAWLKSESQEAEQVSGGG